MLYFVILVLVNMMWAFQFSGAKIATEQLGPITVALLPLVISTLLLAPLLLLRRDAPRRAVTLVYAVREFSILATFGPIPAQLALVWGVQRSLASNAAVINLTIPVVTAVMAWLLLGEKMTRVRWLSFALAIGGVMAVSAGDIHGARLLDGRYVAGNLLIMLSCCGSSFNNTYSKKLLRDFSPLEVLVYVFIASDLILLPLAVIFEPDSVVRMTSLAWPVWASLGAIAIFSLSISMLLFLWVIDKIDVTQASLSIYLLPVFGVLFSCLTLHERISIQLIAGAILVFASTFLVTFYEEVHLRRARYSHA